MKKSDVIDHFGGVLETAAALGVTRQAVIKWGKEIPKGRAYEIESLTNGKLKVNKTSQEVMQQA